MVVINGLGSFDHFGCGSRCGCGREIGVTAFAALTRGFVPRAPFVYRHWITKTLVDAVSVIPYTWLILSHKSFLLLIQTS